MDRDQLLSDLHETAKQIENVVRQGQRAFMDVNRVHANDATVQAMAGVLGSTLGIVKLIATNLLTITEHSVESFDELNRHIAELGAGLGFEDD